MFLTTYANDYVHSQSAKDTNSVWRSHIWARYNTVSMRIIIIGTHLVMWMSQESGNDYMGLGFLTGRSNPHVLLLWLTKTGRWKLVCLWQYILQSYLLMQHKPELEIGKEELVDFSYVKIMQTWKMVPDLKQDDWQNLPFANWAISWERRVNAGTMPVVNPFSVLTRPTHILCCMADLWWKTQNFQFKHDWMKQHWAQCCSV